MDSLTQLTLGAAVGEAVLGRKIGRKAMLWGAACGTLPDLDVFWPFGDPVKDFTYHRSFSHSILVLSLLTPLLVWLILKMHPKLARHKQGWTALVWLCFMTHILLDCLTVYGTQIFWPFSDYPVGWGSLFIIDPFYTVPLLLGVIAALVMSRTNNRGHRFNRATLTLTSCYLIWSVAAQAYVTTAVKASLDRQAVAYEQLLVSAGPLNTLLWRIVVQQSGGDYYEGYYSLLDGYSEVTLERYDSRPELLTELLDHWPVERLRWFTKGFYKVWQADDAIVISDLRMGAEPDYVFSFIVARTGNPHLDPVSAQRLPANRDLTLLKKVWTRLWSADAS
ncbi:MAG: metal-dependent hydrolase [Desulfuromonadales bacterium]